MLWMPGNPPKKRLTFNLDDVSYIARESGQVTCNPKANAEKMPLKSPILWKVWMSWLFRCR
jgi:hypothetical protein